MVKEGNYYFLVFDSGEIAVQMRELQITKEEAEKVIKNPDCAYEIIIAYKNKEMFGK